MRRHSRVFILIFLCLSFLLADFRAASVSPESVPAISENLDEQGQDFAEEHEGNGPEGGREIPMQRLSLKGVVFALIVLAGSAGVMLLDKHGGSSKEPDINV